MSVTYLINGDTLTEVANAIREKKGTTARIAVVDMASEISSMSIGSDSPLPIEIFTEVGMNALLESAQVGSVYRYAGTTTTKYEYGALYVVEESE